jgi:hypothetical protein
MHRPVVCLLVATALAGRLLAQQPGPGAIDSMALRAHTYFLAHDLLEGRGTGARGADLAAQYLATSAEHLGLAGAGPGGDWFQAVPIVEAQIDSIGTTLTLIDSGGSVVFRSPADFIPNAGTARSLIGFGGETAWIGRAQDVLAHPERLPPLSGRVAIMVGVFGADLAAADTLRARGVAGVIQFVGDAQAYDLYLRSRGSSRMYVADPEVHSSFTPELPAVIARAALIRRLLPTLTSDDQLDRPFAIAGRQVRIAIRVQTHVVPARNVAAVLRGTDSRLRDEYVAYAAHYDHLGIGEPDAAGDSIYNGFSDNAAGCAMLLAIAKYFTAHRPARSILFLWFTGEERGLLGSDYFAAHPLVPPGRINGVINLDAGAPPAPPVVWRIAGADRSGLGPLAIEVAREAGWEGQPAPASPNTDYFPFLGIGVPAVFLVPAPAPFEGLTTEASQSLRRRWDHYHEAADNWAADYPFSGLVRYADFALRLGLRLASGPKVAPAR